MKIIFKRVLIMRGKLGGLNIIASPSGPGGQHT